MIEHDRIGLFDPADEVLLRERPERHNVRQVPQDAFLVMQGGIDEIGDHNLKSGHELSIPPSR